MPFKKTVRKLGANVRLVTTPSPYGIHGSMVVTDEDILGKLTVAEGETLVKDDQGVFAVPSLAVDNGLACHLRTCESHRAKWDAAVAEAGIDLTAE